MAEVMLLDALRTTAPNGKGLLLGVLDTSTLDNVLDDEYQRERLPVTSVDGWKKALQAGEVPPLVMGVRGDRWGRQGNKWVLHDPAYVIDGLQRLTAARSIMAEGVPPFLLTAIHLGTNPRYERELFLRLNSTQRKVGANVLLRNVREREPSVAVLFSYSHFEQSPLNNRVTWAQVARKSDLMTAVMLLRVASAVHAHFGPTQYTRVQDMLNGLDGVVNDMGAEQFSQNIIALFEMFDSLWKIGELKDKRHSLHLKLCWMLSVCRLLAQHQNFWDGHKLVIPDWAQRKLGNYKVDDPLMEGTIKTFGRASDVLVASFVDHLNVRRPNDPLVKWPTA